MSFSSEVKDELCKNASTDRASMIAELAAMIAFCGKVIDDEEGKITLVLHTENAVVAKRIFTLIKEAFEVHASLEIKNSNILKKNHIYEISVDKHEECVVILQTMRVLDFYGNFEDERFGVNPIIFQDLPCKRAFIRGAFLSSGSLSDPDKNYHYEIANPDFAKVKQLKDLMNSFDLDAKMIRRKKYYVVYIKEGSQIVDILNIMEAHIALMKLENVRILKDMRNQVNRRVNCETANIQKTMIASTRQKEDIEFLMEQGAFGSLPPTLQEVATLRLEYPDASLKALGDKLDPPVGKSGVNHRLRKISEISRSLREGMEIEEEKS